MYEEIHEEFIMKTIIVLCDPSRCEKKLSTLDIEIYLSIRNIEVIEFMQARDV